MIIKRKGHKIVRLGAAVAAVAVLAFGCSQSEDGASERSEPATSTSLPTLDTTTTQTTAQEQPSSSVSEITTTTTSLAPSTTKSTLSEETIPESTLPEETIPESTLPEETIPESTTTSTAAPTTTTTIPQLDASRCESTYVPSVAEIAENEADNLGIMGRSNLVNDCKALVAIRNHFITNNPNLNPNHFLHKWGTDQVIQGDPTNRTTNKIGFWPGVTVHRIWEDDGTYQTRVIGIHLSNPDLTSDTTMKLSGSLPIVHILKLTALGGLQLSNNKLTGSISDEFGKKANDEVKLSSLAELILDNNELTGSIPANIFNLEHLNTLNLSNNSLSGSIPTGLGKLTNLYRLMLNDNNLTGSIPALDELTELRVMDLSDNELEDSIPALGKLTNLKWIDLSDNELEDDIPVLDELTNLRWIDLSNNELDGNIPSFAKSTGIRHIDLSDNNIPGEISGRFDNLSELEYLDLRNNSRLTGTTPANICSLGTKAKLTGTGLTACS